MAKEVTQKDGKKFVKKLANLKNKDEEIEMMGELAGSAANHRADDKEGKSGPLPRKGFPKGIKANLQSKISKRKTR